MKTIKFLNIRVLSVLALALLSLSSCLKDPRFIDFTASPPLVEFPLTASTSNKTTVIGPASPAAYSVVAATAGTYNLQVPVNLASADVLGSDVTFTVVIDNSTFQGAAASTTKPTVATPANGANIAGYFPLPTSTYTVTGLTGTIKAGSRLAYVNVAINTAAVGNSIKNYALRFVITSASQQISNYKEQTYLFQFQ